MQVRALKTGYFGALRKEGDVFDVPDGAQASWFVPVETEPAEKPKKPKEDKPA